MNTKKAGRLLLVDDEELNLESLSAFLTSSGFEVVTARNGREALEVYNAEAEQAEPFRIVLTDLRMPVMTGDQLIAQLLSRPDPPVILIQSVVGDVDRVIQFIKQGVYDYVIKPYGFDELLHRIRKAGEYDSLREVKKNLEREKELRLQQQLHWNFRKEQLLKRSQDKVDSTIIHNIKTSFSQGGGFGALLSLIKIIEQQAKQVDGGYLIDPDLMQLVFTNAKAATSIIELFEEIDGIEIAPISQKPVSAAELHSSLEALVKELRNLTRIQSQRIIVGERGYVPESLPLAIDLNLTEKVFRELLVNAMKFSVPSSEIYVTFQMAEHGIRVSVLNSPVEDQFGHRGIPPEYQNIIFDPFYRMSKHVFEEYGTHDFGLGLTLVDRILRRMGGSITAYNVKNHLNREMSDLLVNFEVELKSVDAV